MTVDEQPTSTPESLPADNDELPIGSPAGSSGEEAGVARLASNKPIDPCVTPSATSTVVPTMTPTSTPTPTQGVAQLPSTGQADVDGGSSTSRIILLAAAGLVLFLTALISFRRKPA